MELSFDDLCIIEAAIDGLAQWETTDEEQALLARITAYLDEQE